MTQYAESIIDDIVNNVSLYEFAKDFIELEEKGRDFFGVCPFHAEKTASFSITPSTNRYYCFGCHAGGNIINFVMGYKKLAFPQAVEFLVNYANMSTSVSKKESETFSLFKKMSRLSQNKVEFRSHPVLPNDIMDQYDVSGLELWRREGISDAVLTKYQVRFDRSAGRIVYPIHSHTGEIINVKGRIVSNNWKERQMRKYTYYYPVDTSDFLFGYHQNKCAIQEANSVIVFESAKSVMKMESIGIKNCVSIETSRMTDEQIALILSLKCDTIIALDKDVDLARIKKDAKLLSRLTNVYAVIDTLGLLGEKDAPCDLGLDVWNKLYANKVRV